MGTSNSQHSHSMEGGSSSSSSSSSGPGPLGAGGAAGEGDSPSSRSHRIGRSLRTLVEGYSSPRPLQPLLDMMMLARQSSSRDLSRGRNDVGDDEDEDDDDDDEEEEDDDSDGFSGYDIDYEKEETCTRRHIVKPSDSKNLEESQFSLMTKMNCGLKAARKSQCEKPPAAVLKMISQREVGMRGGSGFTSQDFSRAMHHFIPNDMTVEDRYHHKAFCGTYSQDGNFFLTACQDRKLRLYRTIGKNFTLLRKISARDVGWSILDTAFSPDGSSCVYSSWSDSVYHVQLFGDSDSQDALQLNPDLSRFCIFSLVFSQDGQEILCGANEGTLYIYDRFSNQRILKIDGHYGDVNTVAYADNTSQILYSGSDDGLCKVWDRRTLSETDPKPVGVLAGHQDGITYIEPRGDGRHFLSNSKDQTIKLWDVRSFSSEDGQEETRKAVGSNHWDYRWQKVPSKFRNPSIRLKGDTSVMTYRGHSVLQTLIRCHFSPIASTGQRYIYTGCALGRIFIFDALTGKHEKVLFGHKACVRDVSWHPYKPELTSTSWDTVVGRWHYRGWYEGDDDDYDDESDQMLEFADGSGNSQSKWHRRDPKNGNQEYLRRLRAGHGRSVVKRRRDY